MHEIEQLLNKIKNIGLEKVNKISDKQIEIKIEEKNEMKENFGNIKYILGFNIHQQLPIETIEINGDNATFNFDNDIKENINFIYLDKCEFTIERDKILNNELNKNNNLNILFGIKNKEIQKMEIYGQLIILHLKGEKIYYEYAKLERNIKKTINKTLSENFKGKKINDIIKSSQLIVSNDIFIECNSNIIQNKDDEFERKLLQNLMEKISIEDEKKYNIIKYLTEQLSKQQENNIIAMENWVHKENEFNDSIRNLLLKIECWNRVC